MSLSIDFLSGRSFFLSPRHRHCCYIRFGELVDFHEVYITQLLSSTFSALSRRVPKRVLNHCRRTLAGIFKAKDVLSETELSTVQAMVILSLQSDIHGKVISKSASALWNRLGAAIRMAQDLGLHRERNQDVTCLEDLRRLEMKRRVWGGLVVMDRWGAACLGLPQMIQ